MDAEDIAAGRARYRRRLAAATGPDAADPKSSHDAAHVPGPAHVDGADTRRTLSGLPLDPVYGPSEAADVPGFEGIGWPGEYPFTRGIHTTGYRGKPWTVRQFAGFGSAAQTNDRFRRLLASGGDGLSVAFDMPTLMGRDSDEPQALGEVGHCGVAIDSTRDMSQLFAEIDLDQVTTSMTISGPAIPIFCMYVAAAERQGADISKLSGTLQTDIFKEYIAQKEWLFPPPPHLRLIGDLMAWTGANMPRFNPISISGYHIREAGATAAQELAFTLADGFGYVELGMARGLDVNEFAPRLTFFFDAHIDFFEEIAKFRAARRIWARWMRDEYGATSERAQWLKFHTQTAGVSLTAQQPDNNVVRTTVEALAAVLGGTNSLHTNALDEVLALPTEHAAELALRTQQVLMDETGVASVVDPLGGSWFVEALTDQIESEVESLFAQIRGTSDDESMTSGILNGIASGWFSREIAEAAYQYQADVETGRVKVVGVNVHTDSGDQQLEVLKVSRQIEADQKMALATRRGNRDHSEVEAALAHLRQAATSDDNLVPLLLEAARAEATLGEMCGVLREVFGEYRENPAL